MPEFDVTLKIPTPGLSEDEMEELGDRFIGLIKRSPGFDAVLCGGKGELEIDYTLMAENLSEAVMLVARWGECPPAPVAAVSVTKVEDGGV